MAIISFDKDAVIDYVPEYHGNRDSDDPCVVRLRFVSYGRVQEYARAIAARTKGAADDARRFVEVSGEVQRRQFIENVAEVLNFRIAGAGGAPRAASDPGEFYDNAPMALVQEVIRAMEDSARLTEGQRKNS